MSSGLGCSVRYCVSAGEALPAHLFRSWKEKTGLVILDQHADPGQHLQHAIEDRLGALSVDRGQAIPARGPGTRGAPAVPVSFARPAHHGMSP